MKTPPDPTLSGRVFRTLLFLFPPAFRRYYGKDIASAFDRNLQGTRGRRGTWLKGLGMTVDLLANLPGEWGDQLRGKAHPTPSSPTARAKSPQRSGVGLDFLRQDLRIGARSFARQPGFTAISMVMIALGIGATTTIFSVVDGVLLRGLPYPSPTELVFFTKGDHTPVHYRDWEAGARPFATLAAALNRGFDLVGGGDPERVQGAMVTSEFLTMYAATPAVGRGFVSSDFVGETGVVVLAHGFWERRFGADPNIVGSTITLSDGPALVIGVLHSSFLPPEALVDRGTDVWLPLDLTLPEYQDSSNYILTVGGRLKPGITLPMAQSNLNALATALAEENGELHRERDGSPRAIEIASLMGRTVRDVKQGLVLLFGAVVLMLLIACANVANLFLARGTARSQELAVRSALGARPGWLIRQLMTESVLLSIMGGVFGVAISFGGVRAFHFLMPGGFPLVDRIQVDLRVLGFSLAVCLFTGVLFGIAPAWQALRMDVAKHLKESSSRGVGGFRRARLRNGLLVGQISMSLVLLVGAGLLFNSFVRLNAVDPGFEADGLAVIPLFLDREKYSPELRATLARELVGSVERVSGVEQAAVAVTFPLQYFGGAKCCWFNSDFRTASGVEPGDVGSIISPVSRDYFRVLGGELRGREFTEGDEELEVIPVVVSESLAQDLFPDAEAIGQLFSANETSFTVIGVVSGLRNWGLTEDPDPEMYVPWEVGGQGFDDLNLLVRTEGDPSGLIPRLRNAVWAVAPGLPVPDVIPMRTQVGRSLEAPRFLSVLLILFATLATLLAAGGIYGSVLYQVRQRKREIGLRLALGAARGQVIGMVVRNGFLLTLFGVVFGVGGALALRRVLEAVVFQISGADIPTLLGAILLVGGVAVAASYSAARKAMVSDLVTALRED